MADSIVIKGAREHNLKNIDLTLPKHKLIVITGLSGSGKSSLAFDTLYAEGQRRYVESLSAYARQFLGLMKKPDVDFIEGLSPSIAINQKALSANPRSTVGTITEIYDYLRLLYARIGIPHCPNDGTEIHSQSPQEIIEDILKLPAGEKFLILAPVVKGRKGEYHKLFESLFKEGFSRVLINGEMKRLDEKINLERYKIHAIDLVIDRLVMEPGVRTRLAQSVELALQKGEGLLKIRRVEGNKEQMYSEKFSCPKCGFALAEIAPRMFSFNSPYGACPTCSGLGAVHTIDEGTVIHWDRSLMDGAIIPIRRGLLDSYYFQAVRSILENFDVDVFALMKDVPKKALDQILYGSGDEEIELRYRTREGKVYRFNSKFKGIVHALKRRFARASTPESYRDEIAKYMQEKTCPDCKGARLKPETLAVTLNGVNIADLSKGTVSGLFQFFEHLPLTKRETTIAQVILKEIRNRLRFLDEVGLSYITLDRKADTLAGGEAQRIRLATQIGSRLTGVLYVLDEPTIGLHPRDNERLISTLCELRELGNTLVVVEHDEETIRRADYVVDLGPGAGKNGGKVVFAGPPSEMAANPQSLTGLYLSGEKSIPEKPAYRSPNGKFIEIHGARVHNLKNLDMRIPLGLFIGLTGVSGSGKSTLLENVLYEGFRFLKQGLSVPRHIADGISGADGVERVVMVDQAPIGRTPRSNPVTYTKAFDEIRKVFEAVPEAKARGYGPGRFSFNVRGGRCEACEGAGAVLVEMHFLPDVFVTCEVCGGKRYNRETLEISYKGKNIADVLDMTVADAVEFFGSHPRILRVLQTLHDVGLGYIHLGQSATTLSGGEAQRVKLATELWKRGKDNLYLLDEPTTGLHFADVEKLLDVLDRLVDAGNTVIVIEHNRDVMRRADYLIDLGPEGGAGGGQIVAQGTPREIARHRTSYTGRYLKPFLSSSTKAPPAVAPPLPPQSVPLRSVSKKEIPSAGASSARRSRSRKS